MLKNNNIIILEAWLLKIALYYLWKTEDKALKVLLFLMIIINKLGENSAWIVLLNPVKVPT